MTTHTVLCELAAFAVYFLYGSFFEWFFHRYLFHSPKYIYRTFREHTLVHHQIYKGDHTYLAPDDHDHPEKVTMDWWAMPMMVLWNLPLLLLVQWVTHIPSLWGGVAAIVVYFTLYESFHWAMHVPKAARFMGRFRVWRFLDDHHHVHHKYMLSNLNVILPLADLTLGTLRDRNGKRIQPLFRRKPDLPVTPKAAAPAAQTVTTATPVKPTAVKAKATAGTPS